MSSRQQRSYSMLSKPQPALNTLPSELRRLIVSHLGPDSKLRPGCKQHLKAANLAHSCLREWVPEYMFRNMALKHVLVGMSSNLECFAATSSNAKLLKFVEHISVQVPPALRWEIGSENTFAHHLDEITVQRLLPRLGVGKAVDLTAEQRQYCSDYYRAMVEPFTDNRSWYRLLRAANDSWSLVFSQFKNLEKISIECCEILDQPSPTYTHTFVLKHGRDTLRPLYIEDDTINMAWASSIILNAAPPSVRHLDLSMANMDNFNSFATVNRLLSMSHRRPLQQQLSKVTRLCLTIRGIAGTHGIEDEHGEIGSAGPVRHWIKALNSLQDVQYLELRDAMVNHGELRFTNLETSDPQETILDWILPKVVLPQLRTLRISNFTLDTVTIQTTFAKICPSLENLVFEDTRLSMREVEDSNLDSHHVEHLRGDSWLSACRFLLKANDTARIALVRPSSRGNEMTDYTLNPRYLKLLCDMPRIDVDVRGTSVNNKDPEMDHRLRLETQ